MHYRRLNQLFFQEEQESPSSGGEAEAEAAVRLIQIGKFVLQRVHASPNIYVIDNFLNASELAYLHDAIAKRKFQRSYVDRAAATAECGGSGDSGSGAEEDTAAGGVAGGSSHYDTTHRTSTFVSFEKQQDAKCAGIENKAAQLLGCWTSIMLEPLQLVRYLPGQFFDVHHDMGDFCPETGVVELPPKSLFSKRRVVTLFCYLNAVTSGGATHFPLATVGAAATATTDAAADHVDIANNDSLPSRSSSSEDGLRVEPVPGRAVLFSNVLSTGLPDPRTIHAGEPVLSGLKYGLNIWICEEK